MMREMNRDMRPKSILQALSDYLGVAIVPGRTLVIFDEIQNCERALTALKYFAEDCPEPDVMAAGSLLGFAVNRQKFSFPVGKVEVLQLYPMDFEECLMASGKETEVGRIREAWKTHVELPSFLHDSLMGELRNYLLLGGMPAVVKAKQKRCVLQLFRCIDGLSESERNHPDVQEN